MTNGAVVDEWARDKSVTVVDGDTKFTAFRIFSKNKKNKATFQQAQIQSSNDNCNPGLSGDMWKGVSTQATLRCASDLWFYFDRLLVWKQGSVGYKGGVNRVKNLNTKKKDLKKAVEKVTGSKFPKVCDSD